MGALCIYADFGGNPAFDDPRNGDFQLNPTTPKLITPMLNTMEEPMNLI